MTTYKYSNARRWKRVGRNWVQDLAVHMNFVDKVQARLGMRALPEYHWPSPNPCLGEVRWTREIDLLMRELDEHVV